MADALHAGNAKGQQPSRRTSGRILKRTGEREILEAIAEVRGGGAPMARLVVHSFQTPAAASPKTETLSPHEQEILALLAEGLSNK